MSRSRMPQTITPEYWGRLDKQWAVFSGTLMERDGQNAKFPNGGHNIKHNPLLRAAIEKIRDDYMQLYHQQECAQVVIKEIERACYDKHPKDIEGRKAALKELQQDESYKNAKTAANDAEYDLILYTSQAAEMLQTPGFGFSEADKKTIYSSATATDITDGQQALSKKDAMSIIGSIIGRSIKAYEAVYENFPDFHRPWVIHTAFKKPEAVSKSRSTPIERITLLSRQPAVEKMVGYVPTEATSSEPLLGF